MTGAIAAGLPAAGLLGLGFVVQQHAAAEQPPTDRLRFRLLAHLARQPRWLLGIAAMVGGQLLSATALSKGDLGFVEPVLAANLLFALAISAVWKHRRLAGREWVGAVTLAGGLGGFVVVAAPGGGQVLHLPWPNWALSIGVTAAVSGALVLWGRTGTGAGSATKIAASAGILFGLQDALTRRTLAVLPRGGVVRVVDQWPTYLLIAVGVCGLLLAQSAFEAAPLPASLPAITLAEPITGIAFGASVFSEHLDLAPSSLALELLCLFVAAVGVWLVANSPTLTHARGGEGHGAEARDSRGSPVR